ncbi:MAG: hypothetical protein H7256_13370 [Bdellovibrio sp.]|nr:hypothetical protein [Bdellovibrio sp.]
MNFKSNGRRSFLFNSAKAAGLLMLANTGVYTLGSAFKRLDGSMVAGAKNWGLSYSTGGGRAGCGGTYKACPSTRGTCSPGGITDIVFKCGCDGNEWQNGVYKCQ